MTTLLTRREHGKVSISCDTDTLQVAFLIILSELQELSARLEKIEPETLNVEDENSFYALCNFVQDTTDAVDSFEDAFLNMPGDADFYFKQVGG